MGNKMSSDRNYLSVALYWSSTTASSSCPSSVQR